MILELTQNDIQDFIATTIKNSGSFDALANSLVGQSFNFYKGSHVKYADEELPYCIVYKFNSHYEEHQDSEWIMQFVLGIADSGLPVTDGNGIVAFEETQKLEQLAVEAVKSLKLALSAGLLSNLCSVRISDFNILITEIGEADDIQAVTTLRFQTYSLL